MSFHGFHETWLDHLHYLVDELAAAPKPSTSGDNLYLLKLINRVMTHYDEYYRVKSLAAKNDVLSLFSAPWLNFLERSLHWIVGWRPTTLFHLVYTESSILFESHVIDILRGVRTGDLGDLSPSQLGRVSELQCETVREENAINDELSKWQEGVSEIVGRTCVDLDEKIQRMVSIVEKAEDLRLRTFKELVQLLTPQQATEFLVAAAELQFGVHWWGLNQDRQRRRL